jgi:hypothetical protein
VGRVGQAKEGDGMRIGRRSGGAKGLELGGRAGDGAFLGPVAEAGESTMVTWFKSNSCSAVAMI